MNRPNVAVCLLVTEGFGLTGVHCHPGLYAPYRAIHTTGSVNPRYARQLSISRWRHVGFRSG